MSSWSFGVGIWSRWRAAEEFVVIYDAFFILMMRQMFSIGERSAGRPIQCPDSSTMKPCCCNGCSMWFCIVLLKYTSRTICKPLQMIQNAAARLVFNEPKRAHVTPLFVSLHWLPVAARIQFKTLMLAYRTTTGSAPTYFHSLLRIYIPSRSLRSASERRLVVPSQRGSKSLSRTFSFTVPGRWNDLPIPIRNAGSLSNFKQQLKTHLFQLYLTT